MKKTTRIVATIGPASEEESMLTDLFAAGVDVCRLNYSHGEPHQKTHLYQRIRSIEATIGRPTCILADLPGPKIRLGMFPEEMYVETGDEVILDCSLKSVSKIEHSRFPVEYAGLSNDIEIGDPILIADGIIRLEVTQVDGVESGSIHCKVIDGGMLSSRKGINVPGTHVQLPAIGEADQAAIAHAIEHGADYIAVSFVRSAHDLHPARLAIQHANVHVPLIAKIEHPMALQNLDEILDACDAVMVARGDLGVEIPLEQVPMAQQRIIDGALERGIPVIVATQMLDSMTFNPRPTRAEVSDVSSSIRNGASAVMLSGETATGRYPLQTVQTMVKIAEATEVGLRSEHKRPSSAARFRATRAVAHAGVELALMAGATRILVATEHGNAPRLVAGYRPGVAITAVSDRMRALRRMNLIPGVDTVMVVEQSRGSQTMIDAIKKLYVEGKITSGERVVTISGSPLAMRGATSTLRLYLIGEGGSIEAAQS